jgi:predicted nucleic acid-binding protein
VPAGSAAALICDTGALIDYLVESAPDHWLFRNAIDQARTRYVPGLVLAEVDYFLRDERRAMHVFMQLAESLGIRRLATRDVRHFAAVRLRDGRSFELVVHPTHPDNI